MYVGNNINVHVTLCIITADIWAVGVLYLFKNNNNNDD